MNSKNERGNAALIGVIVVLIAAAIIYSLMSTSGSGDSPSGPTDNAAPSTQVMIKELPKSAIGGLSLEKPAEIVERVSTALQKAIPDAKKGMDMFSAQSVKNMGFDLLDFKNLKTNSGLDFEVPAFISFLKMKTDNKYGYTRNKPVGCIKVKLDNKDTFRKLIDSICAKNSKSADVSEEKGVTFLAPDTKTCFAISGSDAYFFIDEMGGAVEEAKSYFATTDDEKMAAQKGVAESLKGFSTPGIGTLVLNKMGLLASDLEIPEENKKSLDDLTGVALNTNLKGLEMYCAMSKEAMKIKLESGSGTFDHMNYLPKPLGSLTISQRNVYEQYQEGVSKLPEEQQSAAKMGIAYAAVAGFDEGTLKKLLNDLNISLCVFSSTGGNAPVSAVLSLEGEGHEAIKAQVARITAMLSLTLGENISPAKIGSMEGQNVKIPFFGTLTYGINDNALLVGFNADSLMTAVVEKKKGSWTPSKTNGALLNLNVDYEAIKDIMLAMNKSERKAIELKATIALLSEFLGNNFSICPRNQGMLMSFTTK